MHCLFVIDVQRGFVTEQTRHVVPRILSLMETMGGLIIATQFINVENSPFQRIMHWYDLQFPPETDVLPEVTRRASHTVEKNSYSACTEGVIALLRQHAVDTAYLVGMDTDCCVLQTATDLFELGISPIVLADYCASNGGQQSHLAGITVLERTIGKAQIVFGQWPTGK